MTFYHNALYLSRGKAPPLTGDVMSAGFLAAFFVLVLFHYRKYSSHVTFSKNSLEFGLCYSIHLTKAGKVPAVSVIVNCNLVSLIQNDVACCGGNLCIVSRK